MSGDWQTVFRKHRNDCPVDDIPEGWKTADQVAEEIGRSTRTAREFLKKAVKSGDAEDQLFRVVRSDGTTNPKRFYRLKDNGEQ